MKSKICVLTISAAAFLFSGFALAENFENQSSSKVENSKNVEPKAEAMKDI